MESRTSPKLMLATERVSQCSKCNATRLLARKKLNRPVNKPQHPTNVITHLSPLQKTTLAGPQTVYSALSHWVFPKMCVLLLSQSTLNSENRLSLDAFLNPVVLNLSLHASVGVSENASSSLRGCLRNNDPSQRSDQNNWVGRCRWRCATSGKPCNIVGCVVDSRVVK